MIFETPPITEEEAAVIDRIDTVREALRHQLTARRRWVGLLRRLTLARAVLGSNGVEGYRVRLDEAVEAVEGDTPKDIDAETRAAYEGYVHAATYTLQLADDAHFVYDQTLVRALHYMMLKHDLEKSPGRWRPGPVHVEDERTGLVVYVGPDFAAIPDLMHEYVAQLESDTTSPVMVRGAMAHLNLAMIHPFRDGNGRMARLMQTLVLAREGIVAPPFWGIEEYVGENTDDYYRVLADVGAGSWHPERDARPWVRWVLRAHFVQATVLMRRADEASRRWDAMSELVERRKLPERATAALFNAALGLRIRNASYRVAADVSDATATRDLNALANAGLLVGHGGRKGRYYTPSPELMELEQRVKVTRTAIPDPFADTAARSSWALSPTATTTSSPQVGERSPTARPD